MIGIKFTFFSVFVDGVLPFPFLPSERFDEVVEELTQFLLESAAKDPEETEGVSSDEVRDDGIGDGLV